MNLDLIRADFDRIAPTVPPSLHSGPYDAFLLSRVPRSCRRALEVGCGTGELTRQLSARAAEVLAIDLSPVMIAVARDRSRDCPNVEYRVADTMAFDAPGQFDFVVSVATLHHLPFEAALERLARWVAPGGVLLVHDLFRDDGVIDRLASLPAFVGSRIGSLIRRQSATEEARAAWAAHAEHDHFLTMREARRRTRVVLPTARLKRHLFWRYSLVWTK